MVMLQESMDRSIFSRTLCALSILAFGLIAHFAPIVIAGQQNGFDPYSIANYMRWDSGHYLSIATHGYLAETCRGQSTYARCGNGAWMPLYPWIIRFFVTFGVPSEVAGFWISQAALALMMLVVWAFLGQQKLSFRSLAMVLGVAWFPGNIYFSAVFPMSVLGLAIMVFYAGVARGSKGITSIAAFCAPLAYSTGWIVSGCMAASRAIGSLIPQRGRPWSIAHVLKPRAEYFYVLCSAFALVVVFATAHLDTGYWDFYFRNQAAYNYDSVPPFTGYLGTLALFADLHDVRLPRALQAVAVLAFAVFLTCMLAAKKIPRNVINCSIIVQCWAGIVVPAALGSYWAFFRSDTLLVGSVLLMPYLPKSWIVFWLTLFGLLSWSMAGLFFQGALV